MTTPAGPGPTPRTGLNGGNLAGILLKGEAMSQQGAALQSYNNELIKCIEDLCSKRDEVQRQILEEEEEKRKIQNDIRILTERLAQVNESLAQKIATRSDYDQTIAETEAAYKKILESSQTLLHVLKRETSLAQGKERTGGGAASTHRTAPHTTQ